MEDLQLRHIPSFLLARILLQLLSLPPREFPDFFSILASALERYGTTSDLNAFLTFCVEQAIDKEESWLWENYEINDPMDWDQANIKKVHHLVGMRFQLVSETAREKAELIRYGKAALRNPKCVYAYHDRILPINDIMKDTLAYLQQEQQSNKLVQRLIQLRLEQYDRDEQQFKQETNEFDDTTYHLMGVLWVKYDISATEGDAAGACCLYLRDYMESEGTQWRVLLENSEEKISSEQALADIQGSKNASEHSKQYRPVYMFYINQDKLIPPQQEESITLDDYTFEEDDEYYQEPETAAEENELCMHCFIEDIVDDVNDMFFCEKCNRGTHQLCENPPIQAFEKDVDPWYCRACCASLGVDIPKPPTLETLPLDSELLPSKRKREEDSLE